ncbi:MAG: hypothetical protein M1818_001140 [Claussenomyces sp. TS43310]|nr:MAG: hypothetical protein M1818_001140 [Claussenomyces sp. TS43310]
MTPIMDVMDVSSDDDSIQAVVKNRKIDPEKPERPFIEMTEWAGSYKSRFLDIHKDLDKLLKHVNCNYLSTRGQAPTLLELKQHAQALSILIKHLTVSTAPTAVDSTQDARKNSAIQAVRAFDYLADLSREYINKDEAHALPLTGCMNILEDRGVLRRGGREHCPLHLAPVVERPDSVAMPYATQQALIKHADQVLERLDHEFGAEGGILGMLPLYEDGRPEANPLGRNTILGQWISYTRQLVNRVHELGQNLEEALEIVQGEAVVPKARLSQTPLDQRSEGALAVQDQWVVTFSDDVVSHFEREFARLERATVEEQGSDMMTVIAPTRYARLRGGKTIFIRPAAPDKPRAPRPAVVQVVKAEWRDRSSLWERNHAEELEILRGHSGDLAEREREVESLNETIKALLGERSQFLAAEGIFRNTDWVEPVTVTAFEAEKQLFEETRIAARQEIEQTRAKANEASIEARNRRDAVDRYFKSGGHNRPVWPEDIGVEM